MTSSGVAYRRKGTVDIAPREKRRGNIEIGMIPSKATDYASGQIRKR